ncbi:alpha-2-macroglobulin-P-like [Larimichthys crocea]|uniref:alpha-2-macroglobulin-P-like n=1 Tax=Larimichthys crocea TaxID=215358 RepID=UPI000F5FED9C|nr:alpha-2-macroglobulin-P-like [Larimichthys crocea]
MSFSYEENGKNLKNSCTSESSQGTQSSDCHQLYDIIEIEDSAQNRIGQWLNETSNGKILQLSYSLNSEAREGSYQVIVSIGEVKLYHSFKVEKYVLPKFDVKIIQLMMYY